MRKYSLSLLQYETENQLELMPSTWKTMNLYLPIKY